jgi:ABC-type Na+ efflux pump permease subunit
VLSHDASLTALWLRLIASLAKCSPLIALDTLTLGENGTTTVAAPGYLSFTVRRKNTSSSASAQTFQESATSTSTSTSQTASPTSAKASTTSQATGSMTSTASQTSSAPATTGTPTQDGKKGLPVGVNAGIGVGAVVGAAILIALAYCWWRSTPGGARTLVRYHTSDDD